MSKIIYNVISWILVLLVVAFISHFALENGEESSQTSTGVVDTIIDALPNGENVTEEQRFEIHISVRQLAHFSIYFMLGFALANALKATIYKVKHINVLLALPFSVQFSLFDEFVLQQNTSGRGAELKDVITDSMGAALGIICFSVIFIFISLIYKRIKRKPVK